MMGKVVMRSGNRGKSHEIPLISKEIPNDRYLNCREKALAPFNRTTAPVKTCGSDKTADDATWKISIRWYEKKKQIGISVNGGSPKWLVYKEKSY